MANKWFQFVDAATREPLASTRPFSVYVSDSSDVEATRNEIATQFEQDVEEGPPPLPAWLAHSFPLQWRLYADWAAYAAPLATPLDEDSEIDAFGATAATAIIIEVPRQGQQPRVPPPSLMPPPLAVMAVDYCAKAAMATDSIWSQPQPRPTMTCRKYDPLVRLPSSVLAGTGVAIDGSPLVLYRRPALDRIWETVYQVAIQQSTTLCSSAWLMGAAGVGKSSAVLAFASLLDAAQWDVVWLRHDSTVFHCVWLHGATKTTCQISPGSVHAELPAILSATSTTHRTLLVLTGFDATSFACHTARTLASAWVACESDLHRFVCVFDTTTEDEATTLQLQSDGGQEDEEDEAATTDSARPSWLADPQAETQQRKLYVPLGTSTRVALVRVESWTWEDCARAIAHNEVYDSVAAMLPAYTPLPGAGGVDERMVRLKMKHFLAGANAKLLFQSTVKQAMAHVDSAVAMAVDVDGKFDPWYVDELQKMQPEENEWSYAWLSVCVARRLASKFVASSSAEDRLEADDLMAEYLVDVRALRTLCHCVEIVPWEEEQAPPRKTTATLQFFNPEEAELAVDVSVCDTQWLLPSLWLPGGYDAVFVDTPQSLVRFALLPQREDPHGFDARWFVTLLRMLAKQNVLAKIEKVELWVVVEEDSATTFKLPANTSEVEAEITRALKEMDSTAALRVEAKVVVVRGTAESSWLSDAPTQRR